MYNPKSKVRLLLLSSIATMLVEIQGENKRKQEVKPREWANLNFAQNCPFLAYIISSCIIWCMVIPLGPHSAYT
jgi:hypothetical protein